MGKRKEEKEKGDQIEVKEGRKEERRRKEERGGGERKGGRAGEWRRVGEMEGEPLHINSYLLSSFPLCLCLCKLLL